MVGRLLTDASLLALVSVWKSLLVLATDMLPPPPESFNPEDMAMCLQLTHYLSDIATSLGVFMHQMPSTLSWQVALPPLLQYCQCILFFSS